MRTLFVCGLALLAVASVYAAGPERFIAGRADAGAQVVVTNEDTGAVMGFVATPQGRYRAGPLSPGHYAIVEGGAHHAVRHITIDAEHDGDVDLAAAPGG